MALRLTPSLQLSVLARNTKQYEADSSFTKTQILLIRFHGDIHWIQAGLEVVHWVLNSVFVSFWGGFLSLLRCIKLVLHDILFHHWCVCKHWSHQQKQKDEELLVPPTGRDGKIPRKRSQPLRAVDGLGNNRTVVPQFPPIHVHPSLYCTYLIKQYC